MSGPSLVDSTIKHRLSWVPPIEPLSTSQKFNLILCIILFFIPFILYYFYKTKKTPKQKNTAIKNFVKYVKANTKK
jgi:hypothetical protein